MRLLFISFLISVSFINYAQIGPGNYRIYDVKQAREVSVEDVVAAMKNYDVLFFGEEHDDSVAHYLENKFLESMYQVYGDKTTLSLEMFERDVQPIMDEYLTSDIREKNFVKEARVWSNYDDYRPMVEFAKSKKLNVICANAAGRYTNLVGRKGQAALMALPEASKDFMAPLPYDTASGAYYGKLTELFMMEVTVDSITGKKSAAAMGGFNFIQSQSLWDATMAYSIAKYYKKHKGNKVLQVNGRFHSDEHFAVVAQLKNYNPKIKTLVISSGPDASFPNVDWSKFLQQGDYIIITDPSIPKSFE